MEMNRLEGKVAVITGASSGIGKACAIRFASEGAKIVIGDMNVEGGEKTVAELKAAGSEAVFVKTDVTKDEDLDALLNAAIDNFGKIDILYCNAGIAPSDFMENLTIDDYDRTMNINTRSIFVLCKKALPYLKETKGNILSTASCSAFEARCMASVYAASKVAVVKITSIMAREFAKYGVRANTLCPGLTATDILAGVPEEAIKGICADIPLGRLAKPEEQAAAAAFLVSDEAAFITGQSLIVDGGQTAC